MNDSQLEDTLSTARDIVEDVIWSTATTVDRNGTPRSRLVHPVWFWGGAVPFGYVTSRRTALKVSHINAQPKMALFYWSPKHDSVAIDAVAEWVEADQLHDVWNEIASTPPPVGFDPRTIWPDGPTSPDFAVLRLHAYRVIARRGVTQLPMWSTGT